MSIPAGFELFRRDRMVLRAKRAGSWIRVGSQTLGLNGAAFDLLERPTHVDLLHDGNPAKRIALRAAPPKPEAYHCRTNGAGAQISAVSFVRRLELPLGSYRAWLVDDLLIATFEPVDEPS
jgi:hypothetical protein